MLLQKCWGIKAETGNEYEKVYNLVLANLIMQLAVTAIQIALTSRGAFTTDWIYLFVMWGSQFSPQM